MSFASAVANYLAPGVRDNDNEGTVYPYAEQIFDGIGQAVVRSCICLPNIPLITPVIGWAGRAVFTAAIIVVSVVETIFACIALFFAKIESGDGETENVMRVRDWRHDSFEALKLLCSYFCTDVLGIRC